LAILLDILSPLAFLLLTFICLLKTISKIILYVIPMGLLGINANIYNANWLNNDKFVKKLDQIC
jgi:hypothetical protein